MFFDIEVPNFALDQLKGIRCPSALISTQNCILMVTVKMKNVCNILHPDGKPSLSLAFYFRTSERLSGVKMTDVMGLFCFVTVQSASPSLPPSLHQPPSRRCLSKRLQQYRVTIQ